MFLPNAYSFLLVRPVIKKEVIQSGIFGIHPVRSSLAEVSLETRAFGASETSNGIQEPARNLPPSSFSSDSGSPRFGEAGRKMFSPPHQTKTTSHPFRSSLWRGGLQNSHSFLLVRSVISKPVIQSGIQEPATSLPPPPSSDLPPPSSSSDSGSPRFGEAGKPIICDKNKRTFLKMAGIAGASIIGSLLLPKKADALIMGSSPTTGVVGVKNSTNTRINPATEETVSKLSDLTFDTGSLQVKVTSLPAAGSSSFSDSEGVDKKGLVNAARNVQVDVVSSALPATASTEDTLQTISFGGKKYALKMTTVGSVDYIAEADTGTPTASALWRAKKVDSTTGIVITWADGNANFDNSAVDLTALDYS